MRGKVGLLAALLLTGALAGCIGGGDEAVEAQSAQSDEALEKTLQRVETDVLEGEIMVSTATPAISFNFQGTYAFPLERPANATGYVLELVWEASSPASENLDVWVREEGAGNVPPSDPTSPLAVPPVVKATGPSVLHVVVEEDVLEEDVAYEILVRAPSEMGAGLAASQPFELHVSTFLDQPVDEGFSALA
ncbi:MAG: hypothetical protein R3185_08765 [Candidatus Thermoplasmatota archaeon]|nr:hypothetical protein [Candidatus Thermoplasmatota archaeon]